MSKTTVKLQGTLFTLLSVTALVGVVPLASPIAGVVPVVAQPGANFVTYTEPNFFSVAHPSGWAVERVNENYITLWSRRPSEPGGGQAPPNLIKTDITIVNGSLETAVEGAIATSKEGDSTLTRRGNLKIGGRDAVRIWLTGSSFDFPDTILSFVRYTDNQTISITSYYTASNPTAVDTIQRIHWSFRLLK
ncbi:MULTISPECIES: PsbP-related protein [unclassified Coleofasciculus]|uniref:PsbP-related protein n=1 Tax=unclassified Coleofasciculus TaxID=2692782 RepID=UPI00187F5192|nr:MULTISPECIES: PsbP-related protein [unclassified Coleofasciculus]MBE9151305.1 hypothetical protein [Coleofasciculus sp. LEGE 07092]